MVDIILGLADLPSFSHILARILGVVLLVLSAGALINRQFFQSLCLELYKQYFSVVLVAVLILISTISAILVHNNWSFDLVGVITLILWMVFVASAVCILFPECFIRGVLRIAENPRSFIGLATVVCVLGFGLTVFSFETTIVDFFRVSQPEF